MGDLLRYLWAVSLIVWGGWTARAEQPRSVDSLMLAYGMVEVRSLAPEIVVELKYATTDNFVGEVLYTTLRKAYLERGFATRVAKAQQLLSKEKPGYRLIIYDAARPLSVQRRMYSRVAGTPKQIYVAPASRGGRHNYGVAVDLSIVDATGKPLDMGTSFDFFGEEAHLGREAYWVKQGRMAPEVIGNRALLKRIMRSAGMRPYDKEWWHYQELIPMSAVRARYRILDF